MLKKWSILLIDTIGIGPLIDQLQIKPFLALQWFLRFLPKFFRNCNKINENYIDFFVHTIQFRKYSSLKIFWFDRWTNTIDWVCTYGSMAISQTRFLRLIMSTIYQNLKKSSTNGPITLKKMKRIVLILSVFIHRSITNCTQLLCSRTYRTRCDSGGGGGEPTSNRAPSV